MQRNEVLTNVGWISGNVLISFLDISLDITWDIYEYHLYHILLFDI
jgi:hypothetical protein